MTNYVKWVSVFTSLLLAGCQIPAAMIATGAGAMPAYELPPRPHYDAPAQKIYVIDNDRYFTLENYRRCGGSQIYYNDTRNQIRTFIDLAISAFPGRLLLDGNPDVLVFPSSPMDGVGYCGGDRGCFLSIFYSLDGGRTFDSFHPWPLSGDRKDAFEKARNITVTLKGKQMYVADKNIADVFTLENGIKGGAVNVQAGPGAVPHIRTPSGQDHLTCDDSLRPKDSAK